MIIQPNIWSVILVMASSIQTLLTFHIFGVALNNGCTTSRFWVASCLWKNSTILKMENVKANCLVNCGMETLANVLGSILTSKLIPRLNGKQSIYWVFVLRIFACICAVSRIFEAP